MEENYNHNNLSDTDIKKIEEKAREKEKLEKQGKIKERQNKRKIWFQNKNKKN